MIIDNLKNKVAEYYKSKDTLRLNVLRYFLSKVKDKEIELRPLGTALNDEEVFKILKKQIKERNQSIELYEKGNRTDLVQKELQELQVLNEFAQMFPFDLNFKN